MTDIDTPVRTISDIARLAGVSKSTVSRALSNSSLISDTTKARIRQIAEASNFAIHQGARNLSLQRTETLAVVIPINPEIGRFVTDPFNIELLGAVANALAEYDYDLLVAQVQENNRKSIDWHLHSKRVDGLILFACDIPLEALDRLIEQEAPFILWGPPSLEEQYCSVGSDDVEGGYLATRHLLELGRRRIAFIGGPTGKPEGMQRFQGYERALQEAGLSLDPALVEDGNYTSQSGYEKSMAIMERAADIDAVFACSDLMGIGAIQAMQQHGRTVPADVAVVGYDGSPLTAHCNPPLTTIRQDIVAAGRLLVKNLLQYLNDGTVTNVTLPVELIVRQSTAG